jgi:hypothetical protein
VLQVVASLRETRAALRLLPSHPPAVRRMERVMGFAARRGIVHSRAFRRDQTDDSLPAEAAFENSLLRLERAAAAAGVRSCSIRIL